MTGKKGKKGRTDKGANKGMGIKGKGRIQLYNHRLCVYRGFKLSASNKKELDFCPIEKSQALYEALYEFFHLSFMQGFFSVGNNKRVKSRKVVIVADDFFIPKINIDHETDTQTSLWMDLEHDSKIKDLKLFGYSMQQVVNYALELYFTKRREKK